MREKFSVLSEKRAANLRVRLSGLAVVILALLIARQYIYIQLEFILLTAVLFFAELSTVWLLLRRLEPNGQEPRALLLLLIAGQLQVVAELLLLTWAVYYTGGITSPLLALYFIYIFGDGLTSAAPTDMPTV